MLPGRKHPHLLSRMSLAALAAFGIEPPAVEAQYPQQLSTYVCQTPTFWCAFQWYSGAPNGSPCYCGTQYGPVGGYSINPAGVPNAPQLPAPQRTTDPGRPPTTPSTRQPGEIDKDDCYKGLGNCAGSFSGGRQSTGPDTRRTPGSFTRTGRLAEGKTIRVSLNLVVNHSYTISGTCDDECDDLDLALYRGSLLLEEDTETDASPILSTEARLAGTYSLEVTMSSCSRATCRWEVEIEDLGPSSSIEPSFAAVANSSATRRGALCLASLPRGGSVIQLLLQAFSRATPPSWVTVQTQSDSIRLTGAAGW